MTPEKEEELRENNPDYLDLLKKRRAAEEAILAGGTAPAVPVSGPGQPPAVPGRPLSPEEFQSLFLNQAGQETGGRPLSPDEFEQLFRAGVGDPMSEGEKGVRQAVRSGILPAIALYDRQFQEYIESQPNPSEALAKLNSAYFFAKAHDIPLEKAIEDYDAIAQAWYKENRTPISVWESIRASFQGGMQSMEEGDLWARIRDGKATERDRARLLEIEQNRVPQDLLQRSLPVEILKAAVASIPYSATGLAGSVAGGAAGTAVGTAAVAAASNLLQVSIPGSAVAIAAIAAVGRTLGSMAATSKSMGGLEYKEMIQRGINPKLAATASKWSGLLQAAIESDQIMGLLGKGLGGEAAKKSLSGIAERVIGEAILKGKYRNPIITFALRQGSRALSEGIEEALQESVSAIVYDIVREASNTKTGTNIAPEDWEFVAQTIKENFVQGALASIPMGLLGEPWSIAEDVQQYDQWKAEQYLKKVADAEKAGGAPGTAGAGKDGKPALGPLPTPAKPLAFQDVAAPEADEEGVIHSQLLGNPDPKAKTASVQLDYALDSESGIVTIEGVTVDRKLLKENPLEANAQIGSAVREIRAKYSNAAILWVPKGAAAKLVNQQLLAENPRFFAQDHEAGRVEQGTRARLDEFKQKLVETAGISDQEAADVGALLEARAAKLGLSADEFLEKYVHKDMVQGDLSPRGQARIAKGDLGAPKGQASFWVGDEEIPGGSITQAIADAKVLFHFAKKGDVATVVHEVFGHGLVHTLTKSERGIFEKYVGKKFEDWAAKDHERMATDFEKYMETGKAPSAELASVFERLATFIKQVIENWILQKKLSPEAIEAFDSFFEKSDTSPGQARSKATPESDFRTGKARRAERAAAKAAERKKKAALKEADGALLKVEGRHGTRNEIKGRFSFSLKGSGEGGAAYGAGAYITSDNAAGDLVARDYAEMTALPAFTLDGKELDGYEFSVGVLKHVNGMSKEKALAKYRDWATGNPKYLETVKFIEENWDKIERVKNRRVYKITISDPRGQERFLDLDTPVPEDQLKLIRAEADKLTGEAREKFDAKLKEFEAGTLKYLHPTTKSLVDPRSGWAMYVALKTSIGGPENASAFLDRAGFTGNTYIGDWMKSAGQGVRDYVVFNEDYLEEPVLDDLFKVDGSRIPEADEDGKLGGYPVRGDENGALMVYGDPEEIRSIMPDGVKGKVMEDHVLFQSSVRPRVIAALRGDDHVYSRGGQVTEHPVYTSEGRAGQYVGAPPRANTPATLEKLRPFLKSLTLEGEPGRFWYENSGRAVLAMMGGDLAQAKKFIALLAVYSPQAKVDSNATFAIKAWAQYKAGKPISVKTGTQDLQASEILYQGKLWKGEKTNNFYINLLREVDPAFAAKQGVTVDMWMMRAFGYDNDQPTAAQYRFVENETNRIAQELGWEPQQVQAAIWVAMKARTENKGVKERTEAASEAAGYLTWKVGEDGKKERVVKPEHLAAHRALWFEEAMKLDVSQEDTFAAKFDFSDGLRRHLGQVSWEARPGRTTGVLPGVNDAPYEQQVLFQQEIHEALTGPQGEDLLAMKLGLLVDKVVSGPGVWQGEIAAGMQNLIVMAKNADAMVTPEQRKLLGAYIRVLGYLLRQEGMAWHRPFYNGNKSEENGLELRVGRPLTEAEARALWTATDKVFQAIGISDWEFHAILDKDGKPALDENGDERYGSTGLITSDQGMRLVDFGLALNEHVGNLSFEQGLSVLGLFEPERAQEFRRKMEAPGTQAATKEKIVAELPKILQRTVTSGRLFEKVVDEWAVGQPGLTVDTDRFRTDGDYQGNAWQEDVNGEGYASWLRSEGFSDLLGWAYSVLGPKLQAVYEKYSRDFGWGDPGRIPNPGIGGEVDAGGDAQEGRAPQDDSAGAGGERPGQPVLQGAEAGAVRSPEAAGVPAGRETGRSDESVDDLTFKLDKDLAAEIEAVRRQSSGHATWLKAPNGRPTNLPEYQWLLVRTPAFKKWFGDWESGTGSSVSKVIDENGEPLIQYHGTRDAITKFRRIYGYAGHFGTAEQANSLTSLPGSSTLSVYLNIRHPLRMEDVHFDEFGTFAHEMVASGVVTMAEAEAQFGPHEAWFDVHGVGNQRKKMTEAVDFLASLGYDGIVYRNRVEGVGDSWIPFHPIQILQRFDAARGLHKYVDNEPLFAGMDLRSIASGFGTYAEFQSAYNENHPLGENVTAEEREATLRAAWLAAHPPAAAAQGARGPDAQFLEALRADENQGVRDFLEALGAALYARKSKARKSLDPVEVAAIRVADGKPLSASGLRTVYGAIERNPRKYRERFASLTGDAAMKAQLGAEGERQAPSFRPIKMRAIRNIMSRLRAAAMDLDDETLRSLYMEGQVAYGEAMEAAESATEEVKQLQREVRQARAALADWGQRFTLSERRIAEKTQELRNLRRQIKAAKIAADLATKQKRPFDRSALDEMQAQEAALQAEIHARIKKLPAGAAMKEAGYIEARKARVEALARLREQLAKARAKKAARELAISLAKRITAPVAKATDWRVKQQILAIQRTIDAKFRREIPGWSWDTIRKWFRDGPTDLSKILPEEVVERLQKRPLNLWTIEELQDLLGRVDNLRKLGSAMYLDKKIRKAQARLDATRNLVSTLRESGKYTDAPMTGSLEAEQFKEKKDNFFRKWDLNLETIVSVCRELDNGKDDGYFYQTFVEGERDAYRKEKEHFDRRWGAIEAKMKELDLTAEKLYAEQVRIGDWTISKADAIGIYIGLQDEDTKAKIVYGNMMNEDQRKNLFDQDLDALAAENLRKAQEAAQSLTAAERELARFLIEDADREFQRLAEACYQYENREPPKVAVYFPNEVKSRTGEGNLVSQMREDLLARTPRLGRGVAKGNTLERIKIGARNQLPITLDALGVYRRGIEKQEHYIAYADYVRDMKLLAQNDRTASQFRYMVRQTHGQGVLDYLDAWLDEAANPRAYTDAQKQREGFDAVFRLLRGPLGMAYLGFRTSTALKQLVTSPIPYLPYAGGALVSSMLKNLNIAEYMKALKVAKEKSPFIRHRQMSPALAAIKEYAQSAGIPKAMKAAAEMCMKLTEAADMWSVVSGWMAIYEKTLAELAKDESLSPEQREERAVKEADKVTIRTQPTGRRADLSPAFKSDSEVQKFLLQFQGPMNVIYNQLFHDVPADIRDGHIARAGAIIGGYLATGAILALLVAPRGDDDDEDKTAKRMLAGALRQPLDTLPLVGSIAGDGLESLITGERRYRGSQDAFPALGKALSGAGGMMSAQDEEAFWRALGMFAEGTGMLTGLPTSAIKEYYRVLFKGDFGALLGKPAED